MNWKLQEPLKDGVFVLSFCLSDLGSELDVSWLCGSLNWLSGWLAHVARSSDRIHVRRDLCDLHWSALTTRIASMYSHCMNLLGQAMRAVVTFGRGCRMGTEYFWPICFPSLLCLTHVCDVSLLLAIICWYMFWGLKIETRHLCKPHCCLDEKCEFLRFIVSKNLDTVKNRSRILEGFSCPYLPTFMHVLAVVEQLSCSAASDSPCHSQELFWYGTSRSLVSSEVLQR